MSVDVVVVGSGPNGLAAAVILARAGLEVEVHEALGEPGGGARTTGPDDLGFRYDICSAVHPMACASPFFRAFDLAAHGVTLLQPEVAFAHPLPGGRAGLAWPDLDQTAAGLGPDGGQWRALFRPLVASWQQVTEACMSDFRHPPRPAGLAGAGRLGAAVARQLPPLQLPPLRRFRGDLAPAMLAGVSAHCILPPTAPAATGSGVLLTMLAHAVGWPVPAGGSQAITAALAADLRRHGGRIVTGHEIKALSDLPSARAVVLNLGPAGVLSVAGRDLPHRYARQLRGYRYGGAASTVHFTLSEPVPWAAPGCQKAGTLHLAGTRDEVLAAERSVRGGRHADRPFVLAVQPGVVDPSRPHVLSTYAHVPNGSTADVTEAVIAQVERFAPGFRDIVTGHQATPAARMTEHGANYVGGDIAAGAMTARQVLFRPVPRWDPYALPLPGVYLCSASTPPGPGVHGMAGWHVARRILRHRFGIRAEPHALLVTGG
jgi:phytoene dehydrogenase-like protein